MSQLSSLQKFLSPANLKICTTQENLVWRHHAEWWDTYEEREKPLFGAFRKDDLEAFIKCSQFLQAEAIRYAVEANRRRKWQNCGSIIWQLNEPWPNICCTNLIDYFGKKKLAYHYTRLAFRGVSPTLRYDRLLWSAGEEFCAEIHFVSDQKSRSGSVCCEISDLSGQVLGVHDAAFEAQDNTSRKVGDVRWAIPKTLRGGFLVTLRAQVGRSTIRNQYLMLLQNRKRQADPSVVCAYYDAEMRTFGQPLPKA